MPVILEDDMLIPPSMRRKRYYNTNTETLISASSPSGSTTTIELPSHRTMSPPRNPVVVHGDHYVPVYEDSVREYIYTTSNGPGRSSHHRRGGAELDIGLAIGGLRGAHYVRARSVGPPAYDAYDSYDDEYYLEDGIRHGGRRHRADNHHRVTDASAGLVGAHEVIKHGRHGSHSQYRSSSRHTSSSRGTEHSHHARHLAESGLAAAGLKHAVNHHRQRSYSRGRRGSESAIYSNEERHPGWHDDNHRDHRRALHLAEAGLGIAAAGAAKEVYDHRKRANRRRSSSVSSISSTDANHGRESHNGRHVAAAALGATAAGLAHHKMRHHNERRSSSVSSYSSDEERHSKHRGRKIAGVALGAAAAGMAGKALHDHYRRGSRSRSRSSSSSSSSSSSDENHHRRRRSKKIPAAALGTAAAIAAKRHHDHKRDSRSRSRSRSRSSERHHRLSGPAQKAGYMMAGGLAEKHHRKKEHERRASSADAHREHRHRRASESSGSHSGTHHPRRGSMAGLGGIMNNVMGGARGNEQQQHAPPPHRGIGEKVAYKLGEVVAEEIAGRRGGRR